MHDIANALNKLADSQDDKRDCLSRVFLRPTFSFPCTFAKYLSALPRECSRGPLLLASFAKKSQCGPANACLFVLARWPSPNCFPNGSNRSQVFSLVSSTCIHSTPNLGSSLHGLFLQLIPSHPSCSFVPKSSLNPQPTRFLLRFNLEFSGIFFFLFLRNLSQ